MYDIDELGYCTRWFEWRVRALMHIKEKFTRRHPVIADRITESSWFDQGVMCFVFVCVVVRVRVRALVNENVDRPSFEEREGKGDVATRGEYGQHPGHDGAIVRTMVELERDNVKWMRGELNMCMKNPHPPAIRHLRGEMTDCPNTLTCPLCTPGHNPGTMYTS